MALELPGDINSLEILNCMIFYTGFLYRQERYFRVFDSLEYFAVLKPLDVWFNS